MFFGKKRVIMSLVLAGCLSFTAEFEVLAASPQSEAQAIETIQHEEKVSPLAEVMEELPAMADIAVDTQEWYGKALANTDSEADIYDQAEGTVVGKMYSNTILTIVEEGDTWTKVSSGNVTGYVQNETLLFGSAAVERAESVCANGTKDAKTLDEIEAEKQKASNRKLMAAIIFCEAGNQSYQGKVAVGSVIMNRISSSRFPNSLQGVVYQRGQFTPAMTGKLGRVLASGNIPQSCYDAADDAMNGAKPLGNVLFFNTGHGKIKLGDHYFS